MGRTPHRARRRLRWLAAFALLTLTLAYVSAASGKKPDWAGGPPAPQRRGRDARARDARAGEAGAHAGARARHQRPGAAAHTRAAAFGRTGAAAGTRSRQARDAGRIGAQKPARTDQQRPCAPGPEP